MTHESTQPASRVDSDPDEQLQDAEKPAEHGKLVTDEPGKQREGASPHPAAKEEAKRRGKLVTRE